MSNSGSTPSSTKLTGLICSPTNRSCAVLISDDLPPLVTPAPTEPLAAIVGEEQVAAHARVPADRSVDVAARVVRKHRPRRQLDVVRPAPRLLGGEPRELDHVVALAVEVEVARRQAERPAVVTQRVL